MPRFSKILCPVDFDPGALQAVRLAIELAREHGAVLHLLHVVAVPASTEVPLSFAKLEGGAESRLTRFARQRIGARARYRVHVRTGDPGGEVLAVAAQLGVKLIVMATHGRRGLRRLALGSVAERVVREAPCPVLTVKPRVTPIKRGRG